LPPVPKLIAILLAASCMLLVACGDEDDEQDTTVNAPAAPTVGEEAEDDGSNAPPDRSGGPIERDELETQAPEQVVELVLTTTNPEDACVPPHVTEAYVKAAYGSASGCAQALGEGGAIARRVIVEPVDDSGEEANTIAVARGGVYDGEEIEVRLVRHGDVWSVDAIRVDVPAGP
jgi:hypothetical protein